MKLVESVPVPCRGVDHMDFGANGRFLIASCEFAATLVKVDVSTRRPARHAVARSGRDAAGRAVVSRREALLRRGHDGKRRLRHRPLRLHAAWNSSRREKARTGSRISRDAKLMYVSNRGEGSVSVIDLATRKPDRQVGNAGRRQSGHGRAVGRRDHALVIGSLQSAKSTPSTRGMGGCWRESRSGKGRTAWPSIRSRVAIPSDTTACSDRRLTRSAGMHPASFLGLGDFRQHRLEQRRHAPQLPALESRSSRAARTSSSPRRRRNAWPDA